MESREEHTRLISEKIDPVAIFREASKNWDGGYAWPEYSETEIALPCVTQWVYDPGYYFEDEEVVAVASGVPHS